MKTKRMIALEIVREWYKSSDCLIPPLELEILIERIVDGLSEYQELQESTPNAVKENKV